jgi:hypothetical protein
MVFLIPFFFIAQRVLSLHHQKVGEAVDKWEKGDDTERVGARQAFES